MEFNTIMQALVKDMAEQLRPMVAEMVRQEWTALAAVPATGLGQLAQLADQTAQVDALDNQEWFWAKVANFVHAENAKRVPSPADLVAEVDWSEQLDYGKIIEHVSMADLAGELTANQLEEIAENVSLSDLAGELDTSKIAEDVDLHNAIGEWFSDQSFTIRTN